MSILVTGGAGYIGSHTCVELLEAQLALVEKEVEVTPTPDTPKKGCKGTSSMALVSLIALLGTLTLKRRK